jgi:uroporphyrinogen decarboxylase
MNDSEKTIIPRQRVQRALKHLQPDRAPVDFLAVPEIWERLIRHFQIEAPNPTEEDLFEPAREAVLRALEVDCRVLSYDQFCQPPAGTLPGGAMIDWWCSPARSTPARMWRCVTPSGEWFDIWGRNFHLVAAPAGTNEELCFSPLLQAATVEELKDHRWPEPDWWDFRTLPDTIKRLDQDRTYHLRYRAGSIFEIGWQLRGMEQFLADLVLSPAIPTYIMERLTEVTVEVTQRALKAGGDSLDMVYFYDDVATQNGLMISKETWRQCIRPHHARIIDVAKAHGKQVMYHCDGALRSIIPELIDMGVDLLNPIQVSAKDMDPAQLKLEFGDRLSFHGGIDIVQMLPRKGRDEVQREVLRQIAMLGAGGGYILAGTHHLQADTPLENVLAMYDLALRSEGH